MTKSNINNFNLFKVRQIKNDTIVSPILICLFDNILHHFFLKCNPIVFYKFRHTWIKKWIVCSF